MIETQAWKERRVVPNSPNGLQGPGTFEIYRGGIPTLLLEAVFFPNAACSLQLFEDGQPMSANYPLSAGQPWIARGKFIEGKTLTLVITGTALVQAELSVLEGVTR